MSINPYDLAAVRNAATKKPSAVVAMKRRIRELEAELQARDNCANEVLRILREATGKRDFHSEMEAAEWAAKMIIDLQTQLFLSQQSAKEAMDREAAAVSREIGVRVELADARLDSARVNAWERMNREGYCPGCEYDPDCGFIGWGWRHYTYKTWREAMDAAMKEAKDE